VLSWVCLLAAVVDWSQLVALANSGSEQRSQASAETCARLAQRVATAEHAAEAHAQQAQVKWAEHAAAALAHADRAQEVP
jgi:hypothetical protein